MSLCLCPSSSPFCQPGRTCIPQANTQMMHTPWSRCTPLMYALLMVCARRVCPSSWSGNPILTQSESTRWLSSELTPLTGPALPSLGLKGEGGKHPSHCVPLLPPSQHSRWEEVMWVTVPNTLEGGKPVHEDRTSLKAGGKLGKVVDKHEMWGTSYQPTASPSLLLLRQFSNLRAGQALHFLHMSGGGLEPPTCFLYTPLQALLRFMMCSAWQLEKKRNGKLGEWAKWSDSVPHSL